MEGQTNGVMHPWRRDQAHEIGRTSSSAVLALFAFNEMVREEQRMAREGIMQAYASGSQLHAPALLFRVGSLLLVLTCVDLFGEVFAFTWRAKRTRRRPRGRAVRAARPRSAWPPWRMPRLRSSAGGGWQSLSVLTRGITSKKELLEPSWF